MLPEKKVNILMVDDNPQNLLAQEAILEELGQNIVKASSGMEALKHLLNEDFAVILLDIQMSGMDGFETAELIRRRKISQYIPIIFITAYDKDDKSISKGYSLGAVDYLFRPIVPEILKSKVTIFIELFKKTEKAKLQAELLLEEKKKREKALEELTKANKAQQAEITERKRAEEALAASKSYAESIIQNFLDTLIVVDSEAKIQTVNPATSNLLGYTEKELFGKPVSIMFAE